MILITITTLITIEYGTYGASTSENMPSINCDRPNLVARVGNGTSVVLQELVHSRAALLANFDHDIGHTSIKFEWGLILADAAVGVTSDLQSIEWLAVERAR